MVINERNIRGVFKAIPKKVIDEIDSRIYNFISPSTIKKSIFHYNRFSDEEMELITTYFEVRAKLNTEYHERYRFYFSSHSLGKTSGSDSHKNSDYTEFGYKKGLIHRETPMEKEVVSNPRKPVWNWGIEERYHPLTFRKYPDPKPYSDQPKPKEVTKVTTAPVQEQIKTDKKDYEAVAKKTIEIRENYKKKTKELGEYTWNKIPNLKIENRQYDDNVLNKKSNVNYNNNQTTKKSDDTSNDNKRPSFVYQTFDSGNEKEFKSLYASNNKNDNSQQIKPRRDNQSLSDQINKINNIEPSKVKDSQIQKRKILSSNLERALLNQPVDKEKLKYIKSNSQTSKPGVNDFKAKPFNYNFDNKEKGEDYIWDKRPNLEFKREYDQSVLNKKTNIFDINLEKNKNDSDDYVWDKRPKLK